MNVLAIDTETPKFDDKEKWRGNVYGDGREIVCWSWATEETSGAARWDDECVIYAQADIDNADLVVMFNGKHDVAYLRRAGVDFSKAKVWDCQIAEFVLNRQNIKFPSLNESLTRHNLPAKLDVVKLEYWNKGIDTCDIPWPILSEYAAHDAVSTLALYHAQLEHLSTNQKRLVSLMSQDMLILQEMEQNGLTFNEDLCLTRSNTINDEVSEITLQLSNVYPRVPINFGSPIQLSAFLYGGIVVEYTKVHDGFFKSGERKGQPKLKNVSTEHVLPRMFHPLDKTELKIHPGVYETNEPVLNKIKPVDKKYQYVIDLLLRLAKLDKLNGTYYRGLPKLREEFRWAPGTLHGQFNQTLAGTGRLSSSRPNQQNFGGDTLDIFVSQYE